MKGVQCYELFGGIALKIHTFSFFFSMGGSRPLGSFYEKLSMAVLTSSWWMLLIADL